jgi:hypothetical protein
MRRSLAASDDGLFKAIVYPDLTEELKQILPRCMPTMLTATSADEPNKDGLAWFGFIEFFHMLAGPAHCLADG